jgi:oligosaccharide repeat unit polymerase
MFQFICYFTGAVLIGGALLSYYRSRDALHPGVVLAPTFLFMYAAWPLLISRDGALMEMFRGGVLVHAATIFALSIIVLYAGLLHGSRADRSVRSQATSFDLQLSGPAAQRLYMLAAVIGSLSVIAYWTMIADAGGFARAYGHSKGGGQAQSGYVGEAILLSFPSLLILALAVRQRQLRPADIAVALLIASPQLLQGFFGGRRGPLFLSLSVLFFTWHLARRTRPKVTHALIAITLIGFVALAVASQRSKVYVGSGRGFDVSQSLDSLTPHHPEFGDTYVTAVATIATVDALQDYYWGYRYFVTFVIRPIPKQIWPSKYVDMHADWLSDYGTRNSLGRYLAAVGFALPRGVSPGSIADLYYEFSWGVLAAFYALGRAFGGVWRRHRTVGGYWTVLFYLMLSLSIYLPTQSFSAWLGRLLYMWAISYLLWRFFVVRDAPRPSQLQPA